MKRKGALKGFSQSSEVDSLDYDTYCGLIEGGFKDKDIALEYNLSEAELKQLREEYKEY